MDYSQWLPLGIVWIIAVTTASVYLSLKKSNRPWLSSLIGFLSSFVPVVALIYLLLLNDKPDKIKQRA